MRLLGSGEFYLTENFGHLPHCTTIGFSKLAKSRKFWLTACGAA